MKMVSHVMRYRVAVSCIALLALASGVTYLWFHNNSVADRVYTIGYEVEPPYQLITPDGKPSGLAVDVVSSAAARKGIRLRWVRISTGAEDALVTGKVDLWPFMTVLESRRKVLHLTLPWIEQDNQLVTKSSYRPSSKKQSRTHTIAFHDLPINHILLTRKEGQFHKLPTPTPLAALAAVCDGRADAAFFDQHTGIYALLQNAHCAGIPLRMRALPSLSANMAIGSTFQAAAAADRIREGIGEMAAAAQFTPIIQRWSYFNLAQVKSTHKLFLLRRRELLLFAAMGILAGALFAVAWLSYNLRRARRAADKANAAKTTFLANMSHEIRTPINGVLGLTEQLSDTPLNPEQRELTSTIQESAGCLLNVIDDVLDLARIEAGKFHIDRVAFNPRDLVLSVQRLIAHQSAASGLTLQVDIAATVPNYIFGDPKRLRQILLNLLSNALKFTTTGGITLRLQTNGDRLQFEVADTGIGIPSDLIGRLFTPFTQADPSAARKTGGAGLGLSICRNLIKQMNGKIGVESEPGHGARFWFHVPLELAAGPAPPTLVPDPAPHSISDSPLRVLVAEDNHINQCVTRGALLKLGCLVEIVADGRLAVDAVARGVYDMVFMDCQMPVMDGYEATRIIRAAEGAARHTPIIALTAHAMQGAREQCLSAGMDDYLAKPVTLAQFHEKLAGWKTR